MILYVQYYLKNINCPKTTQSKNSNNLIAISFHCIIKNPVVDLRAKRTHFRVEF